MWLNVLGEAGLTAESNVCGVGDERREMREMARQVEFAAPGQVVPLGKIESWRMRKVL